MPWPGCGMRTIIKVLAQGLIPPCSSMLWFPRSVKATAALCVCWQSNIRPVKQQCQTHNPPAPPKSIPYGILQLGAEMERSLWGYTPVLLMRWVQSLTGSKSQTRPVLTICYHSNHCALPSLTNLCADQVTDPPNLLCALWLALVLTVCAHQCKTWL